jgi:hypothetical protein
MDTLGFDYVSTGPALSLINDEAAFRSVTFIIPPARLPRIADVATLAADQAATVATNNPILGLGVVGIRVKESMGTLAFHEHDSPAPEVLGERNH